MIPERWAQYYLGNTPSLLWLIATNVVAMLVGLRFYVVTGPGLAAVGTFALPLYADSPAALFLAVLSLVTLVPFVGLALSRIPQNRALAYLHTLAFVWLVKYGLWTAIALNVRPELYFGLAGSALWDYWGIILTHLAFVLEALVIPQYGRTTRGALVLALVLLLLNDALDYGLGIHPPLRYDPLTTLLPVITVALSVGSVLLAARLFDRLDGAPTTER